MARNTTQNDSVERDQVLRGGARRDVIDPGALHFRRQSFRTWFSYQASIGLPILLTGADLNAAHLSSKRLQMLQEFVPSSTKVGMLPSPLRPYT
jgi:hypothetical protein